MRALTERGQDVTLLDLAHVAEHDAFLTRLADVQGQLVDSLKGIEPVKALGLLEVCPVQGTDPDVYRAFCAFAETVIGKTVVQVKDTPNFVGNRIGGLCLFLPFRFDTDGLNPLDIDLPPGDPIPSDSRAKWALESRQRLQMLEALPGPPIAILAESPEASAIAEGEAAGGD